MKGAFGFSFPAQGAATNKVGHSFGAVCAIFGVSRYSKAHRASGKKSVT